MNTATADEFLGDSLYELLRKGSYSKHSGYDVRTKYKDGTPAHYISIGPKFVEYDIREGQVPINSLRSFPISKSINEIRWIYQLESNSIKEAERLGIDWWKSWDIGDGTIGIRYGETVRRHELMCNLRHTFINDPMSRRKIMSLWQEQDFKDDPKGLKPCAHTTVWDLQVKPDGTHEVTLTLYQRSMDLLITSSINPFQYWVLGEALMAWLRFATGANYRLVMLRHDIGDVHIYDRHGDAAKEVIQRHNSMPSEIVSFEAPNHIDDWYSWTDKDFKITVPKIKKLESPLELAI